jgi:hypothetical protein
MNDRVADGDDRGIRRVVRINGPSGTSIVLPTSLWINRAQANHEGLALRRSQRIHGAGVIGGHPNADNRR